MNSTDLQTMMFRLHEGVVLSADWQLSQAYTEADIKAIKDPTGATDKNELTSIPSPFARMRIFEDAFQNIADWANADLNTIDGDTIFHKLVSHAFDIGEIFFNFDLFKDKARIEIHKWNRAKALEELRTQSDTFVGHKLLADTLELFIQQADEGSNLSDVENLYLLTYNYKVIGGTSPSTLFFCSANDLSFAQIQHRNDTFFDKEYFPLHRRDIEFQKYLHLLFRVYPALQTKMKLVWNYLAVSKRCLQKWSPAKHDELAKAIGESTTIDKFNALFAEANTGTQGQVIDIFKGIEHRKLRIGSLNNIKSDFIIGSYESGQAINPKLEEDVKPPLVLQRNYNRQLEYVNGGTWSPEIPVPYVDDRPIDKRSLPGQAITYPYLTVSDFLEPTLVQLTFAMDKNNFFTGNMKDFNPGQKGTSDFPDPGFLLPIKRTFFQYFDTQHLLGRTPSGEPVFQFIKINDDKVKVQLRLPIKYQDQYLLFERIYEHGVEHNLEENKGNIVRSRLNLGFLPFIDPHKMNVAEREYRVALIDMEEVQLNMAFYDNISYNQSKKITKSTIRSEKRNQQFATSKYAILKETYDYIQIQGGAFQGIVIPQFKSYKQGAKAFTFAIDFGTTNTHVEYAVEGSNSVPFDITANDLQLVNLYDRSWEYTFDFELIQLLLSELIPFEIGEEAPYSFPQRTAISEVNTSPNYSTAFALGDINIPFYFEKWPNPINSTIITNLKWAKLSEGADRNNTRVKAFLETLLILIRNKVLLNGGNLSKTKLVYFLPSSMSTDQQGKYMKMWKNLFIDYFPSSARLQKYSESEAPYYGYDQNKLGSDVYPAINIDIGGGTTDIIVFRKAQPSFLTSIKFAGNAVFGDAYGMGTSQKNGFVRIFRPVVEKFLNNNAELFNLSQVFAQLSDHNKYSSADVMAFFFSFERNKEFQELNSRFSLSEYISDDNEFNIVFLVFYSSIIYHIARVLRILDLPMPGNIALSGNGSKIVNLLCDDNWRILEKFTEFLIVKAYEKGGKQNVSGNNANASNTIVGGNSAGQATPLEYHDDGLRILQEDHPKRVTCTGGIIKANRNEIAADFDHIVYLGDEDCTLINEEKINYERKVLKYKTLNDTHFVSVVEEVHDFIDTLFSIHEDYSFAKFSIQPAKLEAYKNILKRGTKENLFKGLNERKKLTDETENVAESLFFYPLVGALYALTSHIADNR